MLHLFHGDYIEASRQELQKLREQFKGKEIITLDGKTVTLTDLKQATESTSLFGTDRLVVVENLFSKRISKKSSEFEIFADFIKQLPPEAEIVFWEEKEIPKTTLTILPKKADIAIFKPDRIIFSLMDSLRPGNTVKILELLEESAQKDTAELIFAMFCRQFRYLIMIKDLGKNIPELSPWQTSKFAKQAEYFSLPQVIILYKRLLDIDIKMKSGASAFSLLEELRLFIIGI